jgi:predicted DNA-binding transcriptional regulator AlpA
VCILIQKKEHTKMSKRLLHDTYVAERYGVSVCTLSRWERDDRLNFPKAIKIRGRNYRDEAQLDAFDDAAAANPTARRSDTFKEYRERTSTNEAA